MSDPRLLRYARSSYVSLDSNEDHNFAAEHALRIYRSNSIYSFIPKNACSTMRLSLAIANCCIGDASDFNWIHRNNATFSADLKALVCADYTFVILRDPLARLASCYLDKFVAKETPAWEFHTSIDRTLHPDDMSFADFVERLRAEEVRDADIHWRPQTDFLVYDRYDDYFAVEQFASAAVTIKQRAGLDIVDARPLTRHGSDRFRLLPANSDFSRTPAFDIALLHRNGESPHPCSLYTPDLAETVATIYAADMRLYADKIGLPTMMESFAKT